MIISTTPTLEGKKISEYYGMVSGEAIMGADLFKDLFASIRNIVGGRSAAYEEELRKAKNLAVQEMAEEARRLGGNAVVADVVAADIEVRRTVTRGRALGRRL